MSYEHQRWENRVFLYGYAGKLSRDVIVDYGPDKGRLNVGWWLKVTTISARTGHSRQTVFWCKARGALAEKIKLKFTSPRFMRIEGRLMMYNGAANGANQWQPGDEDSRTFTYIEILHLWWVDAAGREDSTVVLLKTEHDRLRKIEEVWSTGVSRFNIPEEKKAALMEYLHDDEEEPAPPRIPAIPAAPPLQMSKAQRNGEEPSTVQRAAYPRKKASRRPSRPRYDRI